MFQATQITKQVFGVTKNGETIHKYLLANDNGLEVDIITLGGVITSLRTPDKNGHIDDVVLGFDEIAGYERADNPYFSGIIGRCAGRITKGQFTIDGINHQVSKNWGEDKGHHSHGGHSGWDKKVWNDEIENNCLKLTLTSPDMDEGFPGEVKVIVTYNLTSNNELLIEYRAITDKATVINLTNHPYFNLGGHNYGDVYDHVVEVFADKYQEQENGLPTCVLSPVDDIWLDLRKPTLLGDMIGEDKKDGYDFAYESLGTTGKKYCARVHHPSSGRIMEVYTDQPSIVFYTGNFLDIKSGGKNNSSYPIHSGFCLEPMNFADAANYVNLPDVVLRPKSEYRHSTWYKFSIENK